MSALTWLLSYWYLAPPSLELKHSSNTQARLYRILKKTIISLTASRLAPIASCSNPSYTPSKDVTVIIPTIDPEEGFKHSLLTVMKASPLEILIVTDLINFTAIKRCVDEALQLQKPNASQKFSTTVKVHTVEHASKRLQMVKGIKQARGNIIVFADDDAFWPPSVLKHLLSCFENASNGGGGVLQKAYIPPSTPRNMWQFLAAIRLEKRMVRIAANNYVDGGMSCLSGRTVAYRAAILKTDAFMHAFTHDFWINRYLLDSGDDVFITHWLFRKGWRVRLQTEPAATIGTTVERSAKYLKQSLRWSRNSKRSQFRCLLLRPWMWRQVSNLL
jgi:cellulose synthase/poly-beta-1,6-N-acetylglucosamine synthase-like glycosyltransferase